MFNHTAVREFSWICSISAKRLFERQIWGTVPVSLTQNFVSPIRRRLLYDLRLIVKNEGIRIIIITDVLYLVFLDTTVLRYFIIFFKRTYALCLPTNERNVIYILKKMFALLQTLYCVIYVFQLKIDWRLQRHMKLLIPTNVALFILTTRRRKYVHILMIIYAIHIY